MTPYSISCTTCGARLKVRDEQAVGQLSLCPKCGSMVMITPPAPGGDAPPAAAPPHSHMFSGSSPQLIVGGGAASDFDDAAALFADTMDEIEPKTPAATNDETKQPTKKTAAPPEKEDTDTPHSPAPPPIEPPTESMSSIELDPREAHHADDSPLAKAGAAGASSPRQEKKSQSEPAKAAKGGQQPKALQQPAAGTAGDVAAPPSPAIEQPNWTTPAQAAWRRYGLLAVAVLAALGFVGGVSAVLWPTPKPAVLAGEQDGAPGAADSEDDDGAGTDGGSNSTSETPANDSAANDDGEEDGGTNETADTSLADGDDSSAAAVGNATNKPDPPATPTTDEAPPIFVAGADDDGAEIGDDDPDRVATADTGLGDLTPFIDAFPIPPPRDPRAAPEAADDPAVDAPDADERPRPEMPEIDVEARLADKMAGIDAGGAPLAKFVQLISDWSTIPITLDPDALAQAKTDPRAPMSLTMTDATVAQVLKTGLLTQGLSYEIRENQVVVVAARRSGERFLTAKYDVSDLAADATAMQTLIEYVQTLVEPATWEAAGGEGLAKSEDGKLLVRNTQDVHFAVHVFLQKLRVARGLAPRSSFDPSLFALTTRTAKSREKLNKHVVAVFHAQRPLTRILGHLEKAADVNLLVDWQSLTAAGWPTTSTAKLIADDVPLEKALDKLLTPMDLTWRAIDENTIQIVSRETLTTTPELEFYPIAEMLERDTTPEKLVADVKAAIVDEKLDAPGAAIRYDESAKCLLLLAPQKQQRIVARRLATPMTDESK